MKNKKICNKVMQERKQYLHVPLSSASHIQSVWILINSFIIIYLESIPHPHFFFYYPGSGFVFSSDLSLTLARPSPWSCWYLCLCLSPPLPAPPSLHLSPSSICHTHCSCKMCFLSHSSAWRRGAFKASQYQSSNTHKAVMCEKTYYSERRWKWSGGRQISAG